MKTHTEPRHFPLGTRPGGKIESAARIVFGAVCILVAFYWMVLMIKGVQGGYSNGITVAFLLLFGFYMVWAGSGRAYRFIEIGDNFIRLKKDIFLSPLKMQADEISKIELFPLNAVFFLTGNRRKMLRFGATFHETNETIKDALLDFAEANKIAIEIIEEKL